MPGYFRFLTLRSLRVFLEAKVDVAILEVGLGGCLDATNVVARPVVSGVALIDYDHCEILGNTLRVIATEKAGIFKEVAPGITLQSPPQPGGCASYGGCAEEDGARDGAESRRVRQWRRRAYWIGGSTSARACRIGSGA